MANATTGGTNLNNTINESVTVFGALDVISADDFVDNFSSSMTKEQ